jgi:hypothetical protein
MGTKRNPGQYDCYFKAELDEPIFTLRGKDPVAWFLVMLWVRIREVLAGDDLTEEHRAKLKEAWKCAEAMRSWPRSDSKNTQVARVEALANSVMTWFADWLANGGRV